MQKGLVNLLTYFITACLVLMSMVWAGMAKSAQNDEPLGLNATAVGLAISKEIAKKDGDIRIDLTRPLENGEALIKFYWSSGGYFSIENGAWGNNNSIYLIFNNKEKKHCHSYYNKNKSTAEHLSVVWSQENGVVSMALNGFELCNIKLDGPVSKVIGPARLATEYISKVVIGKQSFLNNEISFDDQKRFRGQNRILECSSSSGSSLSGIALFVSDHGWMKSDETIRSLVKKAKNTGASVIIPLVANGRGAYFRSNVVGFDPFVRKFFEKGRDPLRDLINNAKKNGIEVHPWFVVVRRLDGWLPQFEKEGVPHNSFNVHDKSFRDFYSKIVKDFVEQYKPDGINLDFVRSMGVCDSLECSKDFYKKFNKDLNKVVEFYPTINSFSKMLSEWNKVAVSALVESISLAAKSTILDIEISVDVRLENKRKLLQGQDPAHWLDQGWVDRLYDMNYGYDVDLRGVKKFLNKNRKYGSNVSILLGSFEKSYKGIYPRNKDILKKNVCSVLKEQAVSKFVGLYDERWLTNEQMDVLKKIKNIGYHER